MFIIYVKEAKLGCRDSLIQLHWVSCIVIDLKTVGVLKIYITSLLGPKSPECETSVDLWFDTIAMV